MAQLDRSGHRKRIRASYLANGIEGMADHQVLELLLSLVIPQKDVKPLAYDLINHFGSLENILNSSAQELMQVKGVGESTAVAINLVRDINQRVNINKNKNVKIINSSETASQYCINMLRNEPVEKLLVISLSSKGTIISSNIAFKGAVNTTNINMLELMEMIIHSHPSGVIIAHNHPNGNVNPSGDDMSFTIELNSLLRKINVKLLDHIIVSDDKYSCMSNNLEWMAKLDSSK